MSLTRRAMRNEIRTLTAQLDLARQEVDRLQADKYELEEQVRDLTDQPLQDRLVRALHHLECAEAERDEQRTENEELHRRLAEFAARYPHFMGEAS